MLRRHPCQDRAQVRQCRGPCPSNLSLQLIRVKQTGTLPEHQHSPLDLPGWIVSRVSSTPSLPRSTICEPSSLLGPMTAVKLVPSVPRFHRTKHTFRVSVRVQIYIEAERSYGDMDGDPKRHQLLGRAAGFLGLFVPRHPGARLVRDRQGEASRAPNPTTLTAVT